MLTTWYSHLYIQHYGYTVQYSDLVALEPACITTDGRSSRHLLENLGAHRRHSVFDVGLLVPGNNVINTSPLDLYQGHRISWMSAYHQALAILFQPRSLQVERGPGISFRIWKSTEDKTFLRKLYLSLGMMPITTSLLISQKDVAPVLFQLALWKSRSSSYQIQTNLMKDSNSRSVMHFLVK